MKELLIIGVVGWLLYNATRPTTAGGTDQSAAVSSGSGAIPSSVPLPPFQPPHIDIGTTWEDRNPLRPDRTDPNVYESGSLWAAQEANRFANWVDSLQVSGYPHITGVVHV